MVESGSSFATSGIEELIASLANDPNREPVASELGVLQSIYGEDAVHPWRPPLNGLDAGHAGPSDKVRYEVHIEHLPSPHEDVSLKVLVTLPSNYPAGAPPQLQLLSKYIGAFGVDATLFGDILRTYISSNGVEFIPDMVCVFDGLQNVIERCAAWYEDRLSADLVGELSREEEREHTIQRPVEPVAGESEAATSREPSSITPQGLSDIEIVEAEPITDRKSAFVGRACKISHPSQVPLVLNHLMADRRIARAAHPVINAWRCQTGSILHQDNDDDGETAAGGRLAHLLQILDVNNVLVIVTRYFGGIHLGPDRFKHINQAARNALELGGFLDEPEDAKRPNGRGKQK